MEKPAAFLTFALLFYLLLMVTENKENELANMRLIMQWPGLNCQALFSANCKVVEGGERQM